MRPQLPAPTPARSVPPEEVLPLSTDSSFWIALHTEVLPLSMDVGLLHTSPGPQIHRTQSVLCYSQKCYSCQRSSGALPRPLAAAAGCRKQKIVWAAAISPRTAGGGTCSNLQRLGAASQRRRSRAAAECGLFFDAWDGRLVMRKVCFSSQKQSPVKRLVGSRGGVSLLQYPRSL